MTARLLRSELVKLRRTPSTWWLTAAALGVVILGVVLTLSLADVQSRTDIRSLLSFSGTGGLVVLLLGVVVAAGEYRHRTIVATSLVTPRRWPAFAAQAAGLAVFGAAVGLAAAALTTTVSLAWLSAKGVPFDVTAADLATTWLGGTAYTALSAVIGVAVGALARNQVAAAVSVFVYLGMIDPLISASWSSYGQFGPTAVGISLAGGLEGPGGPGAQLLPLWAAGLVYLGCAAALGALGTVAATRRDLG